MDVFSHRFHDVSEPIHIIHANEPFSGLPSRTQNLDLLFHFSLATIPFQVVHLVLVARFMECFVFGHFKASSRVSAICSACFKFSAACL